MASKKKLLLGTPVGGQEGWVQSNHDWEAQTKARQLVSRMYDTVMGHKFSLCFGAVKTLGSVRRRERFHISVSYFIATAVD